MNGNGVSQAAALGGDFRYLLCPQFIYQLSQLLLALSVLGYATTQPASGSTAPDEGRFKIQQVFCMSIRHQSYLYQC
jgi:hypothetical protein